MTEEKRLVHLQTPKGDLAYISRDLACSPKFLDAMMKFQYGEAGESDEGFREMMSVAEAKALEGRIRIQSIAWIICNNGVMPDEQTPLSRVERAHSGFEKLAQANGQFLGYYSHHLYSSSTFLYKNHGVLVENGLQYANESAAHVITLAGKPEQVIACISRVKSPVYEPFRKEKEFDSQGIDVTNIDSLLQNKIYSISDLELWALLRD